MQGYVLGLIDHAHATASELLDDAVVRDGLADHSRECSGGWPGRSMSSEAATLASRTPPWLLSGWGCPGVLSPQQNRLRFTAMTDLISGQINI